MPSPQSSRTGGARRRHAKNCTQASVSHLYKQRRNAPNPPNQRSKTKPRNVSDPRPLLYESPIPNPQSPITNHQL
ncbi:hypothetical protein XACLE20_1530212 [Xanthomonas citri pv. citri]|nr:hypothetical protein XACLE20_1530212 [Xanthomonas citri pv. citri]